MPNGARDLHRVVKPDGDAEDVAAYARVLMDKLRADRFPSIDLLRRVSAFA